MPKENLFAVGDIVVLKSGGPKMTVTYISGDAAHGRVDYLCQWFAGAKNLSATFREEALEAASTPEKKK